MRGEPEIVRLDAQAHVQGIPDSTVVEQYIAPTDGEFDVHKDYDMWCARRAMALLLAAYPGHLFQVQSDVKKHLFKISIPILMGVCNWYVVNLRTHEMSKETVVRAGGEILERYGIPRGRMDLAAFLEAREKHSALVRRSRPVPGGLKGRRKWA